MGGHGQGMVGHGWAHVIYVRAWVQFNRKMSVPAPETILACGLDHYHIVQFVIVNCKDSYFKVHQNWS